MKKEILLYAFCLRQYIVIKLFLFLHIISCDEVYEIKHPITQKKEGYVYKARTFNSLEKFVLGIELNLVNKKGRESIERLENCGVLSVK